MKPRTYKGQYSERVMEAVRTIKPGGKQGGKEEGKSQPGTYTHSMSIS